MTTMYEKMMEDITLEKFKKEMTPSKLIDFYALGCSMCIYDKDKNCDNKDCEEGKIAYLNQEIPLTKEQKLAKVIQAFRDCKITTTCHGCVLAGGGTPMCRKMAADILQEVLDELKSEKS